MTHLTTFGSTPSQARPGLWSQVLPGLYQGGTADDDTIDFPQDLNDLPQVNPRHFDTVVTAYAWARPVAWMVKELRFGFYDGNVEHIPFDQLRDIVVQAHADWKAGRRVLVRCQAGLNRSGLITALILIRDGMSAADAIDLIRERRSPDALFNLDFVSWLLKVDPTEWRA